MLHLLGLISFFGDAGDVTLRCILSGQGHLCLFVVRVGGKGGMQCRACNAYAFIRKIPYFHAFFDKHHLLSFSAKKKKKIIFSGINTIFLDITKKIVFRREFPEKTIFPEHLKKILYFQVLF